MDNPKVVAIFTTPAAGSVMEEQQEVEAIAGVGLKGDRYSTGQGSFNKGKSGKRQVTLMNAIFFKDSGFDFAESRRNIIIEGVELMWLIGQTFKIGGATFKGIKYCDPCNRPSKLAGKDQSFKDTFFDRGGLIAEVVEGGMIRKNDEIIPPLKGY